MMRSISVAVLLVLTACPGKKDKPSPDPKKDAGGQPLVADAGPAAVVLPPAPPLPEVPLGLPPLHSSIPLGSEPTPELVALGDLLFHDSNLSTNGSLSCASCHQPARNFAGPATTKTVADKRNLRRAPALTNLAWSHWLGWDGSASGWKGFIDSHMRGQLGEDFDGSLNRVLAVPLYGAHSARIQGVAGGADARMRAALAAYVFTRYSGGLPWDAVEEDSTAALRAGYKLFTDKAQCANCHPPPLYTDHNFHRIGLIKAPDEGRSRVDGADQHKGAFKTPSLRGVGTQTAFFHDGSATSLGAAIDWHLSGGTGHGADRSIIDPALRPITLTATERADLERFVMSLTP